MKPSSSIPPFSENVSPEWHNYLKTHDDVSTIPDWPEPDDVESWKALQNEWMIVRDEKYTTAVSLFTPEVTTGKINQIPVLNIFPENWEENGKVIVYIHGGAFVIENARTSACVSVPLAHHTKTRVVSVDYTLAPHARWQTILDQVIAVITGLQEQGFSLGDIAVSGDSAGGAIAAGSILKMRDTGLGMPACLVALFSLVRSY